MEHKFYTDDFERLIKEKSDEFRMYPSKRVWHSIYNDLHPGKKWPSIAVALVLVTVLFLIGYWNNNLASAVNTTKQVAQSNTTSPGITSGNQYRSGAYIPTDNLVNNQAGENATQSFSLPVTETPSFVTSSNNAQLNTSSLPSGQQEAFINRNNQVRFTKSGQKNQSSLNRKYNNVAEAAIAAAERQSGTAKNSAESGNTISGSTAIKDDITVKESSEILLQAVAENNNNKNIEDAGELIAAIEKQDILVEKTAGILPLINSLTVASNQKVAAKKISSEDKSWMEDYAFYNRSKYNKWKGRLSSEIFITPGAGFRTMKSNTDFNLTAPSAFTAMAGTSNANANTIPTYKPGATFQAGVGFAYAIAKKLRIKAGLQASFTNYSVPVTEINHPVLTTLTLNDLTSNYPYLEARVSTLANVTGYNNKKMHNQTSQISIPVGLAIKLAGNSKIEWYAGSAIQPTLILGGKANLLSSDYSNYVADPSLLRKWNLNGTAETYIHYKMNGFTLQAGPEFRYQFMSTYSKKYTYNEKLYNIGIKVGIVKNF